MYLEMVTNEYGEPSKYTHLPTPGETLLSVSPTKQPIRCLYRASNGRCFAVSGQSVYQISTVYAWTLIGTLGSGRQTPVYMADNGTNIIIVDGSIMGYSYNMLTGIYKQLTSLGWLGSDQVDFIDTYFLANFPNTPTWYISDSEDITFDPTQFTGKSSYPDYTVAVRVSHHVMWVIGQVTTEVWYNSGGAALIGNTFPFELLPGVTHDYGCSAPYSISKTDGGLIFLGQDINGMPLVMQTKGYNMERISTHGLEHQLASATTSDAVAYSYMQEGHSFYVLTLPTLDRTFVYDETMKLWHERCSIDANGTEHCLRSRYHAFFNGINLVGDGDGNLYQLNLNDFTMNGKPIKRLVSFPRQVSSDDGSRLIYKSFIAEMMGGESIVNTDTPMVQLQYSDDRGKTWSQGVEQSLGNMGNYLTSIKWSRLGMSRNRVFRLIWSANAMTALQGAYVEVAKARS